MKKRLGIISAILVVALVFALTFVLLASAEEVNEATLTITPASGSATTETGSYDEMAERLNASMSSLGAGTAKLTLTANAKATKQLVIPGTGTETVEIDLAGYTLDVTDVTATPIVVGGVASFAINGNYSSNAELGRIVSESADQGVMEISMSEQTSAYELYDLEISYKSSGAAGIAHYDDDELILRNVHITYDATADTSATKIIDASNGSLTLINSSVKDAKTGTGETYGVVATGTTVRFENTEIVADYVYSMNGASWLTAVDTVFDAKTAIFTATDVTDDTVIGAGVTFKGNILGEGATKEMIKLYYGTGSTLIDSDPTDKVTVATTLASLSELASGKWTLAESASTQTIYTQIFDRGDITEKADSLANAATVAKTVQTSKVAVTIAFIQDREYNTTATNLAAAESNGLTSLFVDFNGFLISQNRAAHLFSANGLFRLSIDGADAEGNVGGLKERGYAGGIIYVNNADVDSVFTLRNIDITNTNASGRKRTTLSSGAVSNSSSNMIQLQDCRIYMDGARFIYTGEEFGRDIPADDDTYSYQYYYTATQNMSMVYAQSTAFITADGCSFIAAPSGNIVANNITVAPAALGATAANVICAKNCTFEGVGRVASTTASKDGDVRVADSTVVSVTATAFAGAGNLPILVTDCDITLPEGTALASGKVNLLNGDGNMKITTADGSTPSGTHTLEDGSALYYDTVSEAYTIVSGDAVTTVKMNKLFADGMVFQAGKPINVWGTCDTDGAEITVSLGANSASATVADGKWEATLPAMDYAKGLTLTVTEGGKEIGDTVVKNVDIGEVWAFSGQSNANLGAYKLEDFEEYKALADLYDNIRCFSVAANTTADPLDDPATAEWFQVNSSTLSKSDTGCGISAVGYVMATRLAVELEGNPTIAIIDINYNGKAISNFISNNYEPNGKTSDAEHQIYNSMIAPLEGYNIKGFGWYQGEASSDSGECDSVSDGDYGLNVDQLYATYTETFNKNEGNAPLELFIVQLSVYMGDPSYIRAYQEDIAARNEHYHVISSSWAGSTLSKGDFALDAGNGFQYGHVHAARKSPLGLAMADSILENVYFKDQNLQIANPEIESTEIDGSSVKVTLDRDFILMFGTEVEGFELSADGTTWVEATGTIDGRTITLTASGMASPKYVRYGFGEGYVELENGEKLLFSKSDSSISYVADPASNKATTVTITAGDKTYTVNTADTIVLRSMLGGNIIATNGHTLHVFSTAITSSSAGTN